ncbi:hypothetical protein MJO29_005399, partial [Puccinia striiformis f. sp. tritici]
RERKKKEHSEQKKQDKCYTVNLLIITHWLTQHINNFGITRDGYNLTIEDSYQKHSIIDTQPCVLGTLDTAGQGRGIYCFEGSVDTKEDKEKECQVPILILITPQIAYIEKAKDLY